MSNESLAHGLWAAAQLGPGDGITDGVVRIAEILSQQAPSAVPAGFVLVPIISTPEMHAACRDARAAMTGADKGQHSAAIWTAMLAAALEATK